SRGTYTFDYVKRSLHISIFTICIYHKRGMFSTVRNSTPRPSARSIVVLSFVLLCVLASNAQDWFKTETSSGATNIRIAVADFNANSPDATPLKRTFDATLYSHLASPG